MNEMILEFPILPAHSKGVERAVKLTEDSQTVYGQEARQAHYYQINVPSNKTFIYFKEKLY